MNDEPKTNPLAAWAVRAAALWILAGALFKLLLGTPADLPQVVRDFPLELGLTYKLAIAIELCVASVAILRPRIGWIPLTAVYLVFEVVLVTQMAGGEASCGCFGSDVPMKPWMMMVMDTVLLVAVLVTRPWRITGGLPWVAVLVACAIGIALPFLLDRQASGPAADGGGTEGGGGLGQEWAELNVEDWEGELIYDTELAKWIEGDPYSLPGDGLWVIWRWTCEHCALHLEELALNPTSHPFIVLVRLKEPHDTEANRAVFVMPQGDNVLEASCPPNVEYVITTPGELLVEGGIIVSAEEGVGAE